MTEEEVLVRLKMDASQLDAETRKSLQAIGNFGNEGHKHFLHVGSAGREFHKIMERISEASPLLGEALKLAIDPVVGGLALATVGLGLLKKAWDESTEAAKRAAEEFKAALALTGGATDRTRSVKAQLADRLRAQGYQVQGNPGEPTVAERLRDIESLKAAIALAAHDRESQEKKISEAEARTQEARVFIQERAKNATAVELAENQRKIDQYDAMVKKLAEINRGIEERKNKVLELTEADKDQAAAAEAFERRAMEKAKNVVHGKFPDPTLANNLAILGGRLWANGPLDPDQASDPNTAGALDAATGGYAYRALAWRNGNRGQTIYRPVQGAPRSAAYMFGHPDEMAKATDPIELLRSIHRVLSIGPVPVVGADK